MVQSLCWGFFVCFFLSLGIDSLMITHNVNVFNATELYQWLK